LRKCQTDGYDVGPNNLSMENMENKMTIELEEQHVEMIGALLACIEDKCVFEAIPFREQPNRGDKCNNTYFLERKLRAFNELKQAYVVAMNKTSTPFTRCSAYYQSD